MLTIDINSRLRAYCSPTSTHATKTLSAAEAEAETENPIVYSPIHLVLTTPELLEQILLSLDMKTLLLSTRTSHTFHSLILSSPRLRQLLWLDPFPSPSHSLSPSPSPSLSLSQPLINPLLAATISTGKHSHIRFLELDQPATLGLYPSLSRRLRPSDPPTVCVALQPSARKRVREGGSWRRMMVVQPFNARTRWDAYLFRWATREWDFRYTTTFEDGPPRAGRVVGFALGPGGEEFMV